MYAQHDTAISFQNLVFLLLRDRLVQMIGFGLYLVESPLN